MGLSEGSDLSWTLFTQAFLWDLLWVGHLSHGLNCVCLFVCLFALRPMSTAMVIAGQSVHLTTLFPGQA